MRRVLGALVGRLQQQQQLATACKRTCSRRNCCRINTRRINHHPSTILAAGGQLTFTVAAASASRGRRQKRCHVVGGATDVARAAVVSGMLIGPPSKRCAWLLHFDQFHGQPNAVVRRRRCRHPLCATRAGPSIGKASTAATSVGAFGRRNNGLATSGKLTRN
jgi:hypothetical protein